MADAKLTDMTAASALAAADLLYVSQSAADRKATMSQLALFAATPVAVSGTTKTFALTDGNVTQVCSNAAAQTLTIPPNSSVAFPIGTKIPCFRTGAGLPTFAAGAGVTIRLPTAIKPNRMMGAQATKSGDQTSFNASSGVAPLTFDSESFDTDAFHSTVTNTERLTIPSGLGITKVEVFGNCNFTLVANGSFLATQIIGSAGGNPSALHYMTTGSGSGGGEYSYTLSSGPIPIGSNTYYYLNAYISDTNVTVSAGSFISINVTEINPVGSITYQYGWVTAEKIDTDEWVLSGPALG